jgi:hypothetical protein
MIGMQHWRASLTSAESGLVGGDPPEIGVQQAFTGTTGNDDLDGTTDADTFDMSQGGDDKVDAKGGDDSVYFGIKLTGADTIDGGSGNDTLEIKGDSTLAAGYTVLFTATSLTSVERILLDSNSGFSHYTIALHDGNIVAGETLTVEVDQASLTQDIFVDADFETDGHVNFTGGAGNDSMIVGANLLATDKLDGGTGQNFLTIHGDYSDGIVFNATTVLNFFEIDFGPGFSYNVTLDDATGVAGEILHLDA